MIYNIKTMGNKLGKNNTYVVSGRGGARDTVDDVISPPSHSRVAGAGSEASTASPAPSDHEDEIMSYSGPHLDLTYCSCGIIAYT